MGFQQTGPGSKKRTPQRFSGINLYQHIHLHTIVGCRTLFPYQPMLMSRNQAIIAGATGLIGSALLAQILSGDHYARVIALTRRALDTKHSILEEVQLDFEGLAQLPDAAHLFKNADVYICLGTTMKTAGSKAAFEKVDYQYPLELGRLAKKHGARSVLLISAMGADPASFIYYNKIKGRTEHDLSVLELESLHILRPALLTGKRNEQRMGEEIGQWVSSKLSFLFVGPLAAYEPVAASDVARVMYLIARQQMVGEHFYMSDHIQQLARSQS